MEHLTAEQIGILEALARFQIAAHAQIRASAPPRSEAAAQPAASYEQAVQAVLRRALATGDREHARAPLREVARRIGARLQEDTEDWNRLAFEAFRVLLDLSKRREREELGLYDDESPIFRSVRDSREPTTSHGALALPLTMAMPATQPAAQVATSLSLPETKPSIAPALAPMAVAANSPDSAAAQPSATASASRAAEAVPTEVPLMEPEMAAWEEGGDRLQAEDAARRAAAKPPRLDTLPSHCCAKLG